MNSRIPNILLSVIKATLAGEIICENSGGKITSEVFTSLTDQEWKELIELAQRHNILPLFCDGVIALRNSVPRRFLTQIVGLTLVAEDSYNHRVQVVNELASLYANNNIPFMVIKGYGISLYYPNPTHRTFSDIDTYHFGRFQEADRLVVDELGAEIDTGVHHHTTCVYKGVLIENHYDFINTTQRNSNKRFEHILKLEADNSSTERIMDGVRVLLPSAMFNVLFLMRHMAMHYAAERISIRHLCDWMQFIKAETPNIDWQRVIDIYKEFNMKRFADAITGICIAKLGMEEGLVPDVCSDVELEERIFNDILNPEFNEDKPTSGLFRIVWWKTRRYFSNSWKHKLIYKESVLRTFFQSSYSHLLKPKTIKH